MLQAGAPPTLLVPPEQGALIGAVDAVQGSDAPALDELICLGAAPGVEVDRIVSIGQGGIVVPGGADRSDLSRPRHILEHGHHSGDAPLRQDLIDHIRLGYPHLGQCLLQVIEHDSDGPPGAHIHLAALAGEGVGVGQDGLRFGLRLGHQDRHRGLVGALGLAGSPLPAAGGQRQDQEQAGQQAGQAFGGHLRSPPLAFFPLSYPPQGRVSISCVSMEGENLPAGPKIHSGPPKGRPAVKLGVQLNL